MKISKKIQNIVSEKLILRINELYHNLEHEVYQERHTNMFAKESEKWKDIAEKYLNTKQPITCLDYGTGTGFVPLTIGKYLNKNDILICTDISEIILDICKTNIEKTKIKYKPIFVKINGTNIPIENNSVNIVTVNSVLHHIYNLQDFARETHRVLSENGYLIIVHEPNANTRLPFLDNFRKNFVNSIYQPEDAIIYLTEQFAFIEFLLRKILNKISTSYRKRNKMLVEISETLINEKLIDFKLRGTEIQQLVDIHVSKGFEKKNILDIFHKYKLIEWETYNFLPEKNRHSKRINKKLEKKYPEKGHTLLFILQKK